MAFGKNNEALKKMSLRQKMRMGSKRAPKTGGGRAAPYFVNRYEPPVTGPSDIIRLIPGEFAMPVVDQDNRDYLYDETGKVVEMVYPFYRYINYFHGGKKRGCIGSEGALGEFKGKGDPCIAADWYWWEWRQRQITGDKDHPKAMSRGDKWAFTVVVEAPFYQVPQIDNVTKQLRINPNTKEPYTDWRKGSVRGNDEYAAAGYKRKEGHRQHWSLSYGHFRVLTEYEDTLARHCRTCGGNNTISEIALLCQNCGEAIVVMAETALSDEELIRMRDEAVQCPHCKHNGFLESMIECSGCSKPESATLFDFDLEVKRVPNSDGGGKQTALQILRAIGPRPLPAKYGEDLRKPLDLKKIFAPTPLAEQEKTFGLPPEDEEAQIPRTPVTRSSMVSHEEPADELDAEPSAIDADDYLPE